MILFSILSDIFRRHDTTGGVKVLWIIVIIVLPYLGTFIYLITQHTGMTERAQRQQKAVEDGSGRLVQRLEQADVGQILRTAGGALHLDQIRSVGDRNRQLAERDLVSAGS